MQGTKRVLVLSIGCCLAVAMPSAQALEQDLLDKLEKRNFEVGQPVDRIQNYRINGWNSIDRRNLIFNAGASRNFLITLRNPCDGLRSSETLAFSSTVNSVTNKDRVVVRGSGGFIERCLIDEMYELTRIPRQEQGQP